MVTYEKDVKPMWVLAIDTATPLPGLALAGASFERQAPLPTGRQSSEALLPGLESILSAARLGLADIGRFAVCSGPGSFTGIRVGLATAWGLSRARSIPIETFGSLEAVAELARGSGATRACAAFDAEREEVYFGEYDLEASRARELRPPSLLARESLSAACSPGFPLVNLDAAGTTGMDLPALAAARAILRAPGAATDTPRASYVRLSAAEEYRGLGAP